MVSCSTTRSSFTIRSHLPLSDLTVHHQVSLYHQVSLHHQVILHHQVSPSTTRSHLSPPGLTFHHQVSLHHHFSSSSSWSHPQPSGFNLNHRVSSSTTRPYFLPPGPILYHQFSPSLGLTLQNHRLSSTTSTHSPLPHLTLQHETKIAIPR